jgi:hypothetical protein
MLRAVLLALLLAGCASNNPSEIRVVPRRAPPEAPKQQRFELVETATIETGTSVELWIPLASSEEGVQEIERLDVTVKPDVPYEVTSDFRGNRTLHATSKGPVEVSVTYRVLRTAVAVDVWKVENRELTETERRVLAPDLEPTTDELLASLRTKGRPARTVAAFHLEPVKLEPVTGTTYYEEFCPGIGWVAFSRSIVLTSERPSEPPSTDLVVSRGRAALVPFARVDGAETKPHLVLSAHALDVP